MGIEHAVERSDTADQQLLAQVRRGIDQHARRAGVGFALDQQRASEPAVARFLGIAGSPIVADARHATRGAAPKDGEFQAHERSS
jgi:hypothetical protein